ncbi:double-strand break repair protein AddB [Terricaulis silvestris]|uniref:Double-strand break repair protein AddB n=1 Tax=Terricaulis silvestris TaxID=2686094 RepID=A0A6I6MZW1_9CAUL|nr:double-strand break repair protein AddB [Terricaulis silvestris]QGZ96653.1 double-strand break repair protein AddB [Terricaulis silvestris]
MTSPLGLFEGPAPRLRAAPASAPFLDVLADSMVAALVREDDPFALSDALVLLPNRRAARGLIDAFQKRLGGAAILPAIRPLGDLDEDPQVWGADPIALDVASAIDVTRQRMELAALIRARDKAAGGVEDPARALALADELRKLLDSAAAADEVHWDKLPTLVQERDLARHWEASAQFLAIIANYWPQRLKLDGLSDPGGRRAEMLHALARDWTREPPTRPVIIAGSTGSMGATRALMRVVAALPRGVVVLPGLDVDLDDESWALVGDQHPQHVLKETLAALGVARGDIRSMVQETTQGRARRVLMREALAPAERTADWLKRLDAAGGAAFVKAGAEGLRLVEATTEDEEASAIAILLREALEKGDSAALATPDAGLARRVEAKLTRWGIVPSVSHGRPLRESEAGALIALLCDLARDPGEPVALAAFLKHPRVRLAGNAAALATLEHEALRGARRHETLQDLAALDKLAKYDRARAIVASVEQALAPLTAVTAQPQITLAQFADAIAQGAETATGADVWQERDGEIAAEVLRDAIAHGADLGAMSPGAAPRVLLRLMDGKEAPPASGGDPRVAIWGPLEARLQRRDLMILGGLNEGVWPAPPGEDPFLSRTMREALGLPSLDQRIGLAAHDFAQLANAPNVVLTRSLRRDGSPTLASRWLWRLQTLVQGAHAKLDHADEHLAWARALNAPSKARTPKIPRPKPPTDKRLKRISVTQVESLIRDPYAVYARRILGLEYLKPIGAPAGPAERGTAVHRAIELFEDGADHGKLIDLLDEQLRHAGVSAERRAAERARLALSVSALIDWFAERRAHNAIVYREAKGVLPVEGVELSGVADRIEIGLAHVAVLDFKTGAPATKSQVESGLSPQLPLLAVMLARGKFEGVPAAVATELLYWRFGGADPTPKPLDLDAQAEAEKALSSLRGLLQRYAQADQPFLSKPRVQFVKPYTEYDHLARRKEWADAEGDE